MTEPKRQLTCPDPHDPTPSTDLMLRVLEDSLVAACRVSAAFPERVAELDDALQAYVDYLHILGCPPEHVIQLIKHRIEDAIGGSGDPFKAAEREAIITRAIKIYFDAT